VSGEKRERLFSGPFIALFVAALAFFVAGGIVLPVSPRFAMGPLGADATASGIAIGAFAIASLVVRPAVGWGSDRFGRRPLLLAGTIVNVVALAGHLVVDSLAGFIVVRSLLGIGEALFLVAAIAAIADLAPRSRQGEAINLGSLSVYLGLAIGPFIGETLLVATSFAVVWAVTAIIAAVATVLTLLVPETAPRLLHRGPDAPERPPARFFHPAGILPGFLILTGGFGMAGFFAFVPLYSSELGLAGAGLPLALYAGIVIVLRVVFARLPDEMGPARLAMLALGLSAAGLAVIALVPQVIGLLIGTAVFAAGIAFMFPSLIAVAVSRVDEGDRGSVVGTSSAFLDLSFGLGPALLGVAVDGAGYAAAFLLAAGVALVGTLTIVARRRALVRPDDPVAAVA
jgi:MFS family permease